MRIVGGSLRSRKLCEFRGDFIRPTADSVRENLFNILRDRIDGCDFLDLYCGTGAVGIEALSRGAASVTFNDLNRQSLAILKNNLTALKIDSGVKVYNKDARVFISATSDKFDVIFSDPPYEYGEDALPKDIANALRPHGVLVHESERPFTGELAGLVVYDRRKYGRAHLTFFKKGE